MAQALDISIENMGPKSLESHNRVTISSLCTVFAESEVVSLLAEDKKVEDILYGIHDAIAARVITLVARLGVEETVALTGGVALNKGVVHCLKERIKVPIWTHDKPQIIGAIGAAALALEKSQQR
jgi:predicted CoA-substrate-specific enzyme activase